MAQLPDFPTVRISAERLDIREFGPGDAGLVREVLQSGEWLPLSTALVETSEYPADVDWWLAEAVHEPRRKRTGLNLMMLARTMTGSPAGYSSPTSTGTRVAPRSATASARALAAGALPPRRWLASPGGR